MAVPTFVGAGAGWIVQTGNANGTKTGVTVGNLILVHVFVDGGSTLPSITTTGGSLENLAGTDNALTLLFSNAVPGDVGDQRIYGARALATTVTVNAAVSGAGHDLYCIIYEFADASTGTTAAAVFENAGVTSASANGSTAVINDVAVVTNDADRLALNFVGVDDDNTLGDFTGMTGGTWAEASEFASATGTDACIQLQTAAMPTAGTIDGGSLTMAAADNWSVIGSAIIPAEITPTTPPTLFYVTA